MQVLHHGTSSKVGSYGEVEEEEEESETSQVQTSSMEFWIQDTREISYRSIGFVLTARLVYAK